MTKCEIVVYFLTSTDTGPTIDWILHHCIVICPTRDRQPPALCTFSSKSGIRAETPSFKTRSRNTNGMWSSSTRARYLFTPSGKKRDFGGGVKGIRARFFSARRTGGGGGACGHFRKLREECLTLYQDLQKWTNTPQKVMPRLQIISSGLTATIYIFFSQFYH